MHKPRIAVIGAGPGGLTLARILHLRGIRASVFERDKFSSFRPQGGSLDMRGESGQFAIECAGLTIEFKHIARCEDQEARVLRATARAGGFRRLQSLDGIAVIPPTIEAADQLLYAESELEHVQRALCRAVTTDPITVRDDQGPFIKVGRRRGRAHRSMWDIHRAGNMASPVGFRGSCIDKKNLVASPKSLVEVRGINFVLELRFVVP